MNNCVTKQIKTKCTDCDLYKKAFSPCMDGVGPVPCDIMIVGEAPGKAEDLQKEPFVGKAGRMLNSILEEAGLARENVYLTNACRCRPPENRTPERDEIKACREQLIREIQKVKPKVIIPAGNAAFYSLLGQWGIMKARGQDYYVDDWLIIPTFHPAYVLRNRSAKDTVVGDLQLAMRMISGRAVKVDPVYQIVTTALQAREAFHTMQQHGVVSYDTETHGLSPWGHGKRPHGHGMKMIQFAWSPENGVVFPLDADQWADYSQWSDFLVMLRRFMEDPDWLKKIAHNAKFDSLWLKVAFGIDVQGLVCDTLYASYIDNENVGHRLKQDLGARMGVQPYWAAGEDHTTEDLEILAKYGVRDAALTYMCAEKYKEANEHPVIQKLILPAIPVLRDMEYWGMPVDLGKIKTVRKALTAERNALREEMREMVPPELLTEKLWSSPKQLRNLLFSELGLPAKALTPKGQSSTGKEALVAIAHMHEIVPRLIQHRELEKQISTYLKPLAELSHEGRVHTNYKLHGTVTGRLSSEKPNLQNIPRDSKIRSLIAAPKGFKLIHADFSQIELRVAAMLSKDAALLENYRRGGDLHTRMACIIKGCTEEEFDAMPPKERKEFRTKAKIVNFGFLYGMSANTFQTYAKVLWGINMSLEECDVLRARYFAAFPGLRKWYQQQFVFLRATGYVESPIGRRRRLPAIYSSSKKEKAEAKRQAINSPIQSFASDIALLAATDLWRVLPQKDIRLIGIIHDAVLIEARDAVVEEWVPRIKEIMENPRIEELFGYKLTVPIEVDVTVGQNWGEV